MTSVVQTSVLHCGFWSKGTQTDSIIDLWQSPAQCQQDDRKPSHSSSSSAKSISFSPFHIENPDARCGPVPASIRKSRHKLFLSQLPQASPLPKAHLSSRHQSPSQCDCDTRSRISLDVYSPRFMTMHSRQSKSHLNSTSAAMNISSNRLPRTRQRIQIGNQGSKNVILHGEASLATSRN